MSLFPPTFRARRAHPQENADSQSTRVAGMLKSPTDAFPATSRDMQLCNKTPYNVCRYSRKRCSNGQQTGKQPDLFWNSCVRKFEKYQEWDGVDGKAGRDRGVPYPRQFPSTMSVVGTEELANSCKLTPRRREPA
ncbi:hypothetical protein EVAR_62682_1 [Eumeta japonica]|uniref:Uncharacterized protein n=1 Tax=Eumeta variegata TaxID=151549 RepID=A0A4C1ZYV2_EUMVA|nr:hypothetical protein EVAR_62682_1 [Eumeta japonica]